MDWVFGTLRSLLLSGSGKLLNILAGISEDIFKIDVVKNVLEYFYYLGWIIVVIGILFAIANVYIRYIEGDAPEVQSLVLYIMLSILSVFFLSPGAIQVYSFAEVLRLNVLSIVSATVDYGNLLKNMDTYLSSPDIGISVLWVVLFLIVFIAMIAIVFFQALKRSGLYIIQIMIGYFYLFSLPSGNYDGLFCWIRSTFALAITNVLQMTLLYIALNFISANNLVQIFLAIGILLAATEVDRVADRFGLAVNSRRNFAGAISGARNVTSTVKNIKGLMKR